jgi:adenosylcobinamide kinase/adenosylcobinamide-phosphate guanylyltransferase
VQGAPPPWLYIATAQVFDEEMRVRIKEHRQRRDARWQTIEAPLDLANPIANLAQGTGAVLVDCLTLWLSNILIGKRNIEGECERLLAELETAAGPVVVVANEVGLGLVPDNRLGREFRDAQGRLNQRVAGIADHVVLVAAGLPLTLK